MGLVRLVVRSDLDATEQFKRMAPSISLGCGFILIVGGWYGSTDVASVLQIVAGAAMAGNGAYLAIRNHRRRPAAKREAPVRD
ncbi:hypothetical protein BST12_14345 [Mycobacterium angelicum]|uniref:Uncharacterized protein n=1 Tax=Mycobacterium angelicum TaxID=470074 RepID=A0A1W9ZTB0_MYCAN|nr:hypothetical protein BST12_14345 [Mycobacterium angelicum]